VRLSEGRLAGHERQAPHCSSNMRVVKWIYLKEASRKRVLDGSENGDVVFHSGKNRKRIGAGTRHTSAHGQQQLLEGLGSCSEAVEVKKCRSACKASKSNPQATRAFRH